MFELPPLRELKQKRLSKKLKGRPSTLKLPLT